MVLLSLRLKQAQRCTYEGASVKGIVEYYCAKHTKYGMVDVSKNHEFSNVEGCRRQKVDSHHSDVETVVNASLGGLRRKPPSPFARSFGR